MRIAGKRYRSDIYMDCEQCGGDSTQVKFATDNHKLCTTCEAETLRTCRNCEKAKPLTAFSLDLAAAGSRRRVCKDCVSEARRKKYSIGARCYACNERLAGEARGSGRHCPLCPPMSRPRKSAAHSIGFAELLKRSWVSITHTRRTP